MELIAKIKIENIFKAKDFTDKDTGIVTPGKWKIQTFEQIETEQGTQLKLFDISISEETSKGLREKVGQIVNIPVSTYISNNRVGYYGL